MRAWDSKSFFFLPKLHRHIVHSHRFRTEESLVQFAWKSSQFRRAARDYNTASMAFHKKYFILSLIVAYAILIGVYFWSKPHCSTETSCLRFCCNNTDTCSFDSVTKSSPYIYNAIYPADAVVHSSKLPKFISKSGEPSCKLNHELKLSEWKIGEVSEKRVVPRNSHHKSNPSSSAP